METTTGNPSSKCQRPGLLYRTQNLALCMEWKQYFFQAGTKAFMDVFVSRKDEKITKSAQKPYPKQRKRGGLLFIEKNSWFFFPKLRKRSFLSRINRWVMRTLTLRAWVTCEITINLSNSHVHGTWSGPNNPLAIKSRYLNRNMFWLLNSGFFVIERYFEIPIWKLQSVSVTTKMMTKIVVTRLPRWPKMTEQKKVTSTIKL